MALDNVKFLQGTSARYQEIVSANAIEDNVTAKGDKLIGRYVQKLEGLTWLTGAVRSQGMFVVFIGMFIVTAGIIVVSVVLKSKNEKE